jgi:hypothetical protein
VNIHSIHNIHNLPIINHLVHFMQKFIKGIIFNYNILCKHVIYLLPNFVDNYKACEICFGRKLNWKAVRNILWPWKEVPGMEGMMVLKSSHSLPAPSCLYQLVQSACPSQRIWYSCHYQYVNRMAMGGGG